MPYCDFVDQPRLEMDNKGFFPYRKESRIYYDEVIIADGVNTHSWILSRLSSEVLVELKKSAKAVWTEAAVGQKKNECVPSWQSMSQP